MQSITFGVSFLVRKDRANKDGLIPIYCKIIINGQILKISLNLHISEYDWNDDLQIPKKSCKDFKTFMNVIESFKSRTY